MPLPALTPSQLRALIVYAARGSDERTGCKLPYAGVVLAPCFPLALGICASLLRSRRARLNDAASAAAGLHLGRTWLMAWVDRIPLVTPHSAGAVDEASRGSRRKLRQDSSHRQRTPPPRLATDLSQLL